MRLLALFTLCRAAKKPDPASKRLVIISGPRTGSSLLIQMLRAHDQVLMHGEPFHEFDVRQSRKDGFDGGIHIEDAIYEQRHSDPQKLLEAITATATKELVGFKLFRKHVPSHKLGDVLQWATHVIWLTREDRLAQYVSICLALKSGSWVQFADEKDTKSELRVRGASLRHARKIGSVVLSDEYFRLWQGAQAEFAAYADGITTLLGNGVVHAGVENKAPQILRLSYEEHLCHATLRNDTAQRIQAFLGLAPPSKQMRLPLRQGRDDLAMRVSNWDDEFVVEARRQFDEKRCRIEGRRKRKSYAANAPVTKIDGVLGAANALLRGGATESFVARLERREKEMAARKELEEKERARAREVWERDRQRLARRQREQEEREAKAAKRAAHLGRDGAARLERMMAFRRAKGLGRRLQERDLDEEKNVCIDTHPEAASSIVDALPERCRGRVSVKSVKDFGADVILMKQKWGDNDPQFTRWDLSCLQASAVYYEGLDAPVVIAGGEDVLVRRPITEEELAYTMLGAPWRRTQIRFGGNGGFAVRDPAFVRAEGITIDPRENLDAWANACRKMGRRADDVYLAYQLSRLYDTHKLGSFKPAPRKALQGFAAEMVESPGDPAVLHAAWRHLSIDYVVRQFERPVRVIRDFQAPA